MNGKGAGGVKFLLGFLTAFVLIFVGGWVYLKFGHPPVAAADPAFPLEAEIVHAPLNARIAREMQQPPFPVSEDALEAGASIYKDQCASCHGLPGQPVDFAKWMYPHAPQLWVAHARMKAGKKVVGVSDDEPGETFWKAKNGIRLTGMPAFNHILSDPEIWDVSLLLKNADQPLPDPVKAALGMQVDTPATKK
jgi:thiosulfate dehydrogenase